GPKRRWGRVAAGTADEKKAAGYFTSGSGVSQPRSHTNAVEKLPVCNAQAKTNVIFDMETGDPDDVLTLLLLASHPNVNLRAVTITPGSMEQVALVLWMLKEIQLPEVRVGAQEWPKNAEKKCVRGKFYDSFGRIPEHLVEGIESAEQVLLESCDQDTTLLTGGPLHNLGCVLGVPGFTLGRWVAQGGFAGEGVVPSELQLEKFAGKRTCQTWNFNGNISAAEAALESTCILRKVLVSKNVCHRAVYDNRFHLDFVQALEQSERIAAQTTRAVALKLLCSAMQAYRRGEGKKLHDPLAMAAVVDETVCSFREVRVIRDKQGWGSVPDTGTNTWISIDYDDERFRQILLGSGPMHDVAA
ncbi:unnamed protein product, partial [Durusdinium trenchii]